jgi:hypothetical protein
MAMKLMSIDGQVLSTHATDFHESAEAEVKRP